MEKDIEEIKKIAIKVKTSLEELDKENMANRMKNNCEKGTAVDRSRTAMTVALKKKLKERISEFQTLRQNIQEEQREAVERKIYTQIVDTLAEIRERRDAVIELEKKLIDLQQMFTDMAVLVELHGDFLNDIETQVVNSVDHVQKATAALQEAKKLQKNTRKYVCFALILLLIIIIVALSAVFRHAKSSA
ncbi:Putative syntaxin-131 [Apostasia shenzhenica]|uniref:Syntaxin-131 n=1 Tax=Apostasia shenzhenica TaxID=1088818 RepID=A0A2I0AXQ4_9ASPA|nr:Putative syntaxin-131 [Apostasia shenzhenica]